MNIEGTASTFFDPSRHTARTSRDEGGQAQENGVQDGNELRATGNNAPPKQVDDLDEALSALDKVSSMTRSRTNNAQEVHSGLTLERVMELLS